MSEQLDDMGAGAEFSEDRTYRYLLWRTWDEAKPKVLFIGLNPSTADETDDDPTIRRCIGFAQKWNKGGLLMANLYGFRTYDPKLLFRADDPIGPGNDDTVRAIAEDAEIIIGAWGAHAERSRVKELVDTLPRIFALALTQDGMPRHPLYISSTAQPKPWRFPR